MKSDRFTGLTRLLFEIEVSVLVRGIQEEFSSVFELCLIFSLISPSTLTQQKVFFMILACKIEQNMKEKLNRIYIQLRLL
jgi:hypothetical protein